MKTVGSTVQVIREGSALFGRRGRVEKVNEDGTFLIDFGGDVGTVAGSAKGVRIVNGEPPTSAEQSIEDLFPSCSWGKSDGLPDEDEIKNRREYMGFVDSVIQQARAKAGRT